jgi:hypothetical protein
MATTISQGFNLQTAREAILNVGSFDVIERADPSLDDNFKVIFHREVPVELKLRDSPLRKFIRNNYFTQLTRRKLPLSSRSGSSF